MKFRVENREFSTVFVVKLNFLIFNGNRLYGHKYCQLLFYNQNFIMKGTNPINS